MSSRVFFPISEAGLFCQRLLHYRGTVPDGLVKLQVGQPQPIYFSLNFLPSSASRLRIVYDSRDPGHTLIYKPYCYP